MAIFVLTNAKAFLDGFDISGRLNKIGLEYAAELPDATAFGNTTRTRTGGLKTVKATLEGWQDFANDYVDEILEARLGVSNSVLSLSPDGADEGDPGFFFRAIAGEYKPLDASVGDLAPFTASAEGSDGYGLLRGTVMHNNTRTATGTGTARQLGAVSSTQKLYASLHVLAASAGDTLDLILESDNDSGFASGTTRITFTQVSGGTPQAQFATPVAGAITDDWWRLGWTIAGNGSESFQFVVLVAIQ